MEKKYILKLDDFEHRVLVNTFNFLRNHQVQEGRNNDALDRIILKVIDTPVKKYFRHKYSINYCEIQIIVLLCLI